MRKWYLICMPVVIALAACQPKSRMGSTEIEPTAAPIPTVAQETVAVADLGPASGSDLSGRAVFTASAGRVKLEVHIENVSPGAHALHIHEVGDCGAADASSAGGHWNPTGEEHGKWGEHPFHLGDIGNIEVGDDDAGTLTLSTDLWAVGDGSDRDVVGKSIVVHEGADDYTSQPAGAAGKRIGCGVIDLETPAGGM